MHKTTFLLSLLSPALFAAAQATNPPTDWIDPATGHRIIRLSTEPGSSTLYFHDNSYTPNGDKLIFNSPSGVMVIDTATLGTPDDKATLVAPGGRGANMARRTREVYISRGGAGRGRGAVPGGAPATQPLEIQPAGGRAGGNIFAVNVDTKADRPVPFATRTVINCDETFSFDLTFNEDPTGKTPRPTSRPALPQLQRMFPGKRMEDLTPDQQYAVTKEDGLARRTINPRPGSYVFINLKTGERKETGYQYGDLNHQQFSPTDPNILLYAHEGTWHEVERTWTIRTDGSDMKLQHKRTMDMEINGHEWWSFDGKTIWYDLQTPRSQVFWIGGTDLASGKEVRYKIDQDSWGVHFTSSRDNSLFADDGGDPTQVAFSQNGMWINLFHVQPDGTLVREKLVDMSKHNYVTGARGGVEPNCSITPDMKWVIFTGQFADNQRHVYAVEIAKH